MNVNT